VKKRITLSLILGGFFSTVIIFLFYNQFLYPTIIPMVYKGGASIFADWTVILNANLCLEKGFDVFLENPCDNWNRRHVYGNLLLNIPLIKNFPNFYYFYLPIILGFIFLTIISYSLFNYNNKKYWFSFLILIFSIPVLLVVERSNIDLIIFIFLFIISNSNNFLLNFLLIIISSISKIYPIVLTIIFIFQNNLKKIINNSLFVILFFLLITAYQWESLVKLFGNKDQFTGFGLYNFSFFGILDILKNFTIKIYNIDYSWIIYPYIVLFILIPIFFINQKFYKKIRLLFNDIQIYNQSTFEERMYFLSSSVIIFCYFSLSNFVYREIFFLGIVPLIISLNVKKKDNFLTFFYILILTKFIITTFSNYLVQNDLILNFGPFLVILKHTVDLYLISLILHVYIYFIRYCFKKITNQVPQNV